MAAATRADIPSSDAQFRMVPAPSTGVSLVIFSAVDEVLLGAREQGGATRRALEWLASHEVPVVLISREPRSALLSLQQEPGMRHPFVCEGGASLWIPTRYFPELTQIGSQLDGWNVIDFRPPYDSGHAIRFLLSLYRLSGPSTVIVGIARDAADRALLCEVDVPIVVRDEAIDQTPLLEAIPSAYLTAAAGSAGWCEAILGSVVE